MVCSSATLSVFEYDGLSRRTMRKFQSQADNDVQLHDFYDGQSIIETRSGDITTNGDLYRKNTWGLTYIDELVHMGVAPSQAATSYYFCQHSLGIDPLAIIWN
jgi:hypothetical protein